MESIQGVTARPDIRDLRGDRDTVDSGPVERETGAVSGYDSQPHVAGQNVATRGHVADVVDLATERKRRRKVATKKQPRVATGKPYIEAVKASKGTWAFRMRWYENGHRVKPIYISRVADGVYETIRQGDYENFKEQIIASHMPGAIRASHQA